MKKVLAIVFLFFIGKQSIAQGTLPYPSQIKTTNYHTLPRDSNTYTQIGLVDSLITADTIYFFPQGGGLRLLRVGSDTVYYNTILPGAYLLGIYNPDSSLGLNPDTSKLLTIGSTQYGIQRKYYTGTQFFLDSIFQTYNNTVSSTGAQSIQLGTINFNQTTTGGANLSVTGLNMTTGAVPAGDSIGTYRGFQFTPATGGTGITNNYFGISFPSNTFTNMNSLTDLFLGAANTNSGVTGIQSNLNYNPNSTNWFIHSTGTARSAFQGAVMIGSTINTGDSLYDAGSARIDGLLRLRNMSNQPAAGFTLLVHGIDSSTYQIAPSALTGSFILNQSASTQTGAYKMTGTGTAGGFVSSGVAAGTYGLNQTNIQGTGSARLIYLDGGNSLHLGANTANNVDIMKGDSAGNAFFPNAVGSTAATIALAAFDTSTGKIVKYWKGGLITVANNGLSLSGTTAQLGGNLIQNTNINTTGAFQYIIGNGAEYRVDLTSNGSDAGYDMFMRDSAGSNHYWVRVPKGTYLQPLMMGTSGPTYGASVPANSLWMNATGSAVAATWTNAPNLGSGSITASNFVGAGTLGVSNGGLGGTATLVSGNDVAGVLQWVSSSLTAQSGSIIIANPGVNYISSSPAVIITPHNAAATAIMPFIFVGGNSTSFTVQLNTITLTSGTTYQFNYYVAQ